MRYFLIPVIHIDIKRYLMLIIKMRRNFQDAVEKINFSRISNGYGSWSTNTSRRDLATFYSK